MAKGVFALIVAAGTPLSLQASGFDCYDTESTLGVVLRDHNMPHRGTRTIQSINLGNFTNATEADSWGRADNGEPLHFRAEAEFLNPFREEFVEDMPLLLGRARNVSARYMADVAHSNEEISQRAQQVEVFSLPFSDLSYIELRVDFDFNRPIPPGTETGATFRAVKLDGRGGSVEVIESRPLRCVRYLKHPDDYFERL